MNTLSSSVAVFLAALVFSLGLAAPVTAAPENIGMDPTYAFSDRYPVEIAASSGEALLTLLDLSIDFDRVDFNGGPDHPGTIRAYINDDERATLETAGYTITQIPNEGKEMWEKVQKEWEARGALEAPVTLPDKGDRWTYWYSFAELEGDLQALANDNPDLIQKISIGQSVQGRDIWALKISDNPTIEEAEPEFLFSSTIHGDEVTGMDMCLRMLHYLTDWYGINPSITELVNNVEIWFIPLHNPDGYVNGTRYNAHGVDCNRDFPDPVSDPNDNPAGREPETQHLMYFGYDHTFVLGGNMHGGAEVLNFPWDCRYDHTPDHDLFIEIAEGYTYLNPPLWNSTEFYHGWTHGAEWYLIHGGQQDWWYEWRKELHYTMELSNTKWPPYSQMDTFWSENRAAMLHMMDEVLYGVQGIVANSGTGLPVNATIDVVETGRTIRTDPDWGDYCRLLKPGTYTFQFAAEGYNNVTVNNVVVTHENKTELNVSMTPEGSDVGVAEFVRINLSEPTPNPVNPSQGAVRLLLDLPRAAHLTAGVYDAAGRQIQILKEGFDLTRAGRHTLVWDGTTGSGDPAGSGIYWIRVLAGDQALSRRVSMIR
ncbi:MAG: carboxypeptidase regulatory-like domain-containing protein [Candidatus Eisenbacteria bacterium]|uniref:Carboxypeptidase regulatory-like domain-containing protein n=1 Tax=Eiseniibacteriota bacterium TaxID=2212470 RepID=A0A948RW27_UNCEI|nr:carboxypeptidase regulatory-like domain-containing protein [Candidatus Eisenbacteria bacterium]MBU1948884.1 carboxypeptidase regulatory-like domain-containing protein [Candidatus Eisenbacteria bacterium]MBU2691551.1 carboxypeptidase regulatory-like domain-containing protein [Candidatus Eisenbacteria bacterium]